MVDKVKLVVSFITIITIGGVTNKLSYQIKDIGDPSCPPHFFRKPWFMVMLMFIGMTMSWPIVWAKRATSKHGKGNEALLPKEDAVSWKVIAKIFIPAMGDLIASMLSFTGLVYIGNSTAQMLGSCVIVFVAINSYIFLGRRYNKTQYLGMGITLASLIIIAYAADMAAHDTSGGASTEIKPADQAKGMLLCIFARFVNSIQFVVEEYLMGSEKLDPNVVVATEGVYGLFVTTALVMPFLANIPGTDCGGVYENTKDSFLMASNNVTLDVVLFLYLLGLWGLNALGMVVMKELGAVFRAVSRNLQALFVWLLDLAFFYGFGPEGFGYGPVGEPWKGSASWIQAGGFVVMTTGVLTYAYGNAIQQVEAVHDSRDEISAAPSIRSLANRIEGSPTFQQVVQAELSQSDEPEEGGGLRERARTRCGSTAEYLAI